jgi:uncharacterized protein YjdB
MFGSLRPRRVSSTIAGLIVSVTLGCGEPAGPAAGSVHGAPAGVGDGRVNSIQITPAETSVEEGVTTPLTCTALDSRGVVVSTSRAWTISDENVASVGENGVITGQRAGNTVATCSIDGKTAMATVSVVPSPVAFVEVTPGAGVVAVGNSMQLIATPRDSTGAVVSGHPVKFATPDSNVARVSTTGSIQARVEGTANIVAVSGGKMSSVKVGVSKKNPAPVAGISIQLGTSSLSIGQSVNASATTVDSTGAAVSGRSITWSVSDASVMSSVSIGGNQDKITGRGPGTALLTATSEGKTASVTVAVATASVSAVSVTLGAYTLLPGQTTQATTTVSDFYGNALTGRTVTYTSLDPTIATVSANGLVTAIKTGAVIIRATSEGKTGDASLTVSVPSVATVAVSFASPNLTIGQTTVATATYKDANGVTLTGRSVQWASLNTSVATVSIAGVVTAVGPGTATIRATVESKTGDGTATVAAAQQTTAKMYWTVNISSTLAVGSTMPVTAAPYDASDKIITGKTVTYASLNPNVATVSSTGVLTGVAVGGTTVSASCDGITISVQINIVAGTTSSAPKPGKVARVAVTLSKASVPVGDSAQASAAAFDSAGTAVTGVSVAWSVPSTATSVANVDANGKVKSMAAGSASVVATVSGIAGSAALTVTATSSPTTPVNPPSGSAASVLAFAGPYIMKSQVPAAFSFYETNFKQNSDDQWAAYGPRWDAGNSISGYERAAIYYIWWARTGDATYLDRAHQTAVNYRDNFLIPGGYAVSPHWSQMESLYLDCIIASDQKSCAAIPEVAYRLAAFPPSGYFDLSQGEARIQARVITALWMSEKVTGQHSDVLDQAIVKSLNVMNSDGWAPFTSTCGGSLNYMNGMLYDVLTRIHDQRPSATYNTLIETKAKAYGNYVWSTQWRPADLSFNYMSVYCEGTGSQTAANDLNGLMLPLFGWLGKTTGDATWFTRGDQVLNGMQTASLYLYRQFSESYSSSHRYLGYRWGN